MADFECNFDVPVDQPMNMSWSFMNLTGHVTNIYSTAAVNPPEVFIDVKNISASDAGVYTCEASIGSHTWTAGGVLKVPDPNTTVEPDNQNTTNWHLQVIPSNQTMAPGDTAILLCQFDPIVRDPMTMTWTFTDMAGSTREIYSDAELSPSMTFYVKELAAGDAGVYTCQASYGDETWTANGSLHVHA
ncbi:neural cell adhesion molecule L1-like [Haliotis rubra]|uniref:neural cell adhesion molecule L1-like n=1 Tax=Haliotis rubra TaxID=36100 RepID=UPI001EE5D23E|nr:neural cell adhesion molecule L1-like [Haliotis rubra]